MDDRLKVKDLDILTSKELVKIENALDKLLVANEIQNIRGAMYRFHDDQHIGEPRREFYADKHPHLDFESIKRSRLIELVESLEGNTLIHPVMTPIIEVDETCNQARVVTSSLGYEGLSISREEPMAIWSAGYIPSTFVKQDMEWRLLSGKWQRTVKAKMEKGWVRDMQRSHMKPPLTEEQDKNFLGKYAY